MIKGVNLHGQERDLKSEIIASIESTIYYSPKSDIKFLSVLVSKNETVIYINDFTDEETSRQIKSNLLDLKRLLGKYEFISLVASNFSLNMNFKKFIIENQLKSMQVLSKNTEYFKYTFININSFITDSRRQ